MKVLLKGGSLHGETKSIMGGETLINPIIHTYHKAWVIPDTDRTGIEYAQEIYELFPIAFNWLNKRRVSWLGQFKMVEEIRKPKEAIYFEWRKHD